jgi:uncharacterized protein (TIGR03067 family)
MRRILPQLALLCLAFAPAPFPKPDTGKEDLKKMQGVWVLVSRTCEGKPVSHIVATIEINGAQFTYIDATGSWKRTWLLSLDAKKAPRHFDAKCKHPPFELMRGIYKLEGAALIMCSTIEDMQERPANFADGNAKVDLEVFRRKPP